MKNDTAFHRFLSYVEISTKLATILPFFVTLTYCFYAEGRINLVGTLWLLAAIVPFDLATTMINNYLDRNELGKRGYFSRPVMLAMIIIAVVPALALGVWLSTIYGLELLLSGGFCAAIGIGYTFGPAPISKSPYGEPVSGFTQGFVLPLMIAIVNMPKMFNFALNGGEFLLTLDWVRLLSLFLACVPPMLCIANIMLANNICDYEQDLKNRYTMVRHIGVKNGLRLYAALYAAVYAAIAAAVIVRVLPLLCLAVFLTAPFVYKNVKTFFAKHVKAETFVLTIRNFTLILAPLGCTIWLGSYIL